VSSGWIVKTDRSRCIGSGSCAFAVPEIFDVDDTGLVVVKGPVNAGDERVREAVENCPVSALALVVEDGQ
jgi:ferredoxin